MSRAWPPIFWWLAFQRPPTWALCPTGPGVQLPPRPFLIPKDWITFWSASLPTFLLMLFFHDLVVRAITYDSAPVSFLILTSGSTCDYHSQARELDLWSVALTQSCCKISAAGLAQCHCSHHPAFLLWSTFHSGGHNSWKNLDAHQRQLELAKRAHCTLSAKSSPLCDVSSCEICGGV